jgi:hypothetical protein
MGAAVIAGLSEELADLVAVGSPLLLMHIVLVCRLARAEY